MAEQLSASVVAGVLPTPPRVAAEWSPFSVHVFEVPQLFAGTFSDHVLTLDASGSFRARQAVDGRWREGRCGPGCVGLVPAQRNMAWEIAGDHGPARAISLFIPDVFFVAGDDAGLGG